MKKLQLQQAGSPGDAVSGADIVVTYAPIVKNPKPVIPPEWLKLGSVAVSLDVDATIMATTAHAANRMRVDNGEQFEY